MDVDESVGGGDLCGPRLHLPAADLDRRSALAADKMVVMVRGRTPPIHRLPGVGAHHVDQVGGRQCLQGAIHGGQADVLATAAQFVVQVLGGTELLDGVEQRHDRTTLPGGADAGASGAWIAIGSHFLPTIPRVHKACQSRSPTL